MLSENLQRTGINTVITKQDSKYLGTTKQKHRLRSSIPSASACEGGPANLMVACWTAKQWVSGTEKIWAEKVVIIGHQFHYDQ